MTGLTSSACPSNAMDIILSNIGKIQIDNMRQLLNVDAASSNIRCNENTHIPLLETLESTSPCTLALVAVNRSRSQSLFVQSFGNTVRSMLRSRKHEHLLPIAGTNQMTE